MLWFCVGFAFIFVFYNVLSLLLQVGGMFVVTFHIPSSCFV